MTFINYRSVATYFSKCITGKSGNFYFRYFRFIFAEISLFSGFAGIFFCLYFLVIPVN